MNEIWLPAFGYESYFLVSNTGKVISKRTNKQLKLNKLGTGYFGFVTRFDGRNSESVGIKIHRLVAETFIVNTNNLKEINHVDGDKSNNSVSNLEWVTRSENVTHAYKTGLRKAIKGEDHILSKITEQDVLKIRSLYVPKKFGKRKIARKLNLSVDIVNDVIRNKTWKHV